MLANETAWHIGFKSVPHEGRKCAWALGLDSRFCLPQNCKNRYGRSRFMVQLQLASLIIHRNLNEKDYERELRDTRTETSIQSGWCYSMIWTSQVYLKLTWTYNFELKTEIKCFRKFPVQPNTPFFEQSWEVYMNWPEPDLHFPMNFGVRFDVAEPEQIWMRLFSVNFRTCSEPQFILSNRDNSDHINGVIATTKMYRILVVTTIEWEIEDDRCWCSKF